MCSKRKRARSVLWFCTCSAGLDVRSASGLFTPVPWQVVQNSTNFGVLLYEKGLAPGATLSVDIETGLTEHCAVLVVLTSEQHQQWHQMFQMPNSNSIDSHRISHWRHQLCSVLKVDTVIHAPRSAEYFVGIFNVYQEAFWIKGNVTYLNPGGQHLPLEAAPLPEILWFGSMSYLTLMGAIAFLLLSVCARKSTLVHWLLVFCLWLKAVSLGLEWNYYDILSRYGKAPLWRYQYWGFVSRFQTVCEMALLLVVALGLSLLRPRLTVNETRLVLFMVVLSVFALAGLDAFYENTLDGTMGVELEGFRLIFVIVQAVFCSVTFFAVQFNLQVLNLKLQGVRFTARSTSVLYQRFGTYRRFRLLFFLLVLKPVAIFLLDVFVIQAGVRWISQALDLATSWFIYAALFFTLRPGNVQSSTWEQGLLGWVRVLDTLDDGTLPISTT